jgi:hypothetical protein
MAARPEPDAPPPLLRVLLEELAVRVQLGRGRGRLEFLFRDGRLEEWYTHSGAIPAGALPRVEEPAAGGGSAD